jgi:signal transduction histidine kinase
MKARSIRRSLARALLVWSLVSGAAIATAVWLQADQEVNELLDETLQNASQVMSPLLARADDMPPVALSVSPADGETHNHFAWQLVTRDGRIVSRSAAAPTDALHATPSAGFSDVQSWRVFGRSLSDEGLMLYVAQTREERDEAQAEVALSAVLAALGVGLLAYLWLWARIGHELAPLQRLSARLASLELDMPEPMGTAERSELQPVHDAVDVLAERLSRRIANERAFSGHAAHSLRTPLAAIDAQLAVAVREAPMDLQPRLLRVRDAAGRLKRVVAALLALFRSGVDVHCKQVNVAALLVRLPLEGLAVNVTPGLVVSADPDLLAAALLNLLDNSARVRARKVHIDSPSPGVLRVRDDGPGITPARRAQLQQALDLQHYAGRTGLGLMLADHIARAHGGRLVLMDEGQAFVVELRLVQERLRV